MQIEVRKPVVAVASLGGTITMTARDAAGVTPTLTAADLVGSVPALAHVAELRAQTLFTKPGASLDFTEVLRAGDVARKAVTEGAAGAVLVQGTDTLEETSYLLDLFWDRPEPLVVTGAMRPPTQAGADGPANLYASVLTAISEAAHDQGVLVVLGDRVHAAARVRKSDSTAPDAFDSSPFGPLGRVHEGAVWFGNRRHRPGALPRDQVLDNPRVALLETCLGDDGELLRLAGRGEFDGIVLGAFGAGHLPAALAELVGELSTRIPVVLASRTGSGSILSSTYAFPGSERDLLAKGAISAGWLDPRKARILLWSLLATGQRPEQIARTLPAHAASAMSATARESPRTLSTRN